jgi:uncharacterized coiled-coil protein SlyX
MASYAAVKRTFAKAYMAFTEQAFRRRMDKKRRIEDLVLIFYSNATKVLQEGKAPNSDSWKLLVVRHVTLFVRLIGNTLKDHGNDKDRPELTSRLLALESKLLANDQDLFIDSEGGAGASIEVVAPVFSPRATVSEDISGEISELMDDIAFQKVLLASIDDSVHDRSNAESELRAKIETLEKQLSDLKRRGSVSSRPSKETSSTSNPRK